jgi:N-acetylglucosaminyldiphosphoundecaprenol N-acetyl-beta-D-mannosaminyltransferase
MEAIHLLGVRIHALTLDQLLAIIETTVKAERRAIVANVNVHALNLAYERPWFRDFLNQSQVVFCDGFGVKWAARLVGQHLPERITYADWTWRLAELAQVRDLTLFFLGARPGVAERAADRLKQRCPKLRVLGVQHGFFDKTPGSPENEAVLRAINAVRPNILVLGLGMPLQERWLLENWERVEAGVALTGGAVFDYISEAVQRGPRWMTDHGLEWLARLLIEPRRLWKRYLIGNPLFLIRVLRQRLESLS